MEGQYSEKVMEHFRNPHNVGEIPDADGVGNIQKPCLRGYYAPLYKGGPE